MFCFIISLFKSKTLQSCLRTRRVLGRKNKIQCPSFSFQKVKTRQKEAFYDLLAELAQIQSEFFIVVSQMRAGFVHVLCLQNSESIEVSCNLD